MIGDEFEMAIAKAFPTPTANEFAFAGKEIALETERSL